VLVAKNHYFFQTDATTVQEDGGNGPWMYLVQVGGSATGPVYTVAPPGGVPATLQNNAGSGFAPVYDVQSLFTSQASLDASYPDGTYTFAANGVASTVPVTGVSPGMPMAVATAAAKAPVIAVSPGATWMNGVLVWDFRQDLTLTVTFPGTFTPGKSLLQITINQYPLLIASNPPFSGYLSQMATNAPGMTSNQVSVTIPAVTPQDAPAGTTPVISGYPNFLGVEVTAMNLSAYGSSSLPGGLLAGGHGSVTSFLLETGNYVYLGRPPRLTAQPQPVGVGVGQAATFSIGVDGDPTPTIAWYRSQAGVPGSTLIPGATSSTLSFTAQASDDSANVYAVATNKLNSVRSVLAPIRIYLPPVFKSQPANETVFVGQGANFNAAVSTDGASYQWYFNGVPLAGATSSILLLGNVQYSNAGTYYVVATTPGGSVTSSTAVLTVTAPPSGSGSTAAGVPAFTSPLSSATLPAGITAVFNAAVYSALPATYQWFFNAAPIPGATSSILLLPQISAANVGNYTCTATNSAGSNTSSQATLSLATGAAASDPGHLINLSVLSAIAATGTPLTMGFVSGGPGTQGTENLLMRATGPALAAAPFNLAGTLADPVITLNSSTGVIATNDNWGTPAANQGSVTAADAATGAFVLTDPASLDAALTQTLAAGNYTLQVMGKNGGSGTCLAEIYDNTPSSSYTLASRRLVNVSCLNSLPAQGMLTAGFVVGGNSPRTILIRGIGPALAGFGVGGAMADPQLKLFGSPAGQQVQLGANSGWNGDPSLAAACSSVGAFAIANPASQDAMILQLLQPGAYTAQLSSSTGAAGSALIEVYEVP
jgi:hypothetical protein